MGRRVVSHPRRSRGCRTVGSGDAEEEGTIFQVEGCGTWVVGTGQIMLDAGTIGRPTKIHRKANGTENTANHDNQAAAAVLIRDIREKH